MNQQQGDDPTAHADQGAMQPLNEARRPQRLFGKVKAAMRQVRKKLFDTRLTKISEFLSDDKMKQFLNAVRVILRRRINDTMDNWPVREPHDYRPDARVAILQAVEENWRLFEATEETNALDLDGQDWEADETVLSELIFPPFYQE
ncbi:hypothetical protein LQW54_000774 [Pestalotiopsis sp. IQ-011]